MPWCFQPWDFGTLFSDTYSMIFLVEIAFSFGSVWDFMGVTMQISRAGNLRNDSVQLKWCGSSNCVSVLPQNVDVGSYTGLKLWGNTVFAYLLIGGLEHGLFFHILGMSSSQLTNSIIFQRGRSTTSCVGLLETSNHFRTFQMVRVQGVVSVDRNHHLLLGNVGFYQQNRGIMELIPRIRIYQVYPVASWYQFTFLNPVFGWFKAPLLWIKTPQELQWYQPENAECNLSGYVRGWTEGALEGLPDGEPVGAKITKSFPTTWLLFWADVCFCFCWFKDQSSLFVYCCSFEILPFS